MSFFIYNAFWDKFHDIAFRKISKIQANVPKWEKFKHSGQH